jgi:hypothetical protein
MSADWQRTAQRRAVAWRGCRGQYPSGRSGWVSKRSSNAVAGGLSSKDYAERLNFSSMQFSASTGLWRRGKRPCVTAGCAGTERNWSSKWTWPRESPRAGSPAYVSATAYPPSTAGAAGATGLWKSLGSCSPRRASCRRTRAAALDKCRMRPQAASTGSPRKPRDARIHPKILVRRLFGWGQCREGGRNRQIPARLSGKIGKLPSQ